MRPRTGIEGITSLCRLQLLKSAAVSVCMIAAASGPSLAQVVATEDAGAPIESVEVVFTNPSPDAALNERVADLIRRQLRLFPTDRFSRSTAEIGLARARRLGPVADTKLTTRPGAGGALIVIVETTLRPERAAVAERGFFLTGDRGDLPVLYDRNGTYVTGKLEFTSMLYSNSDAWYGLPGAFLAGNPLVTGTPAGDGISAWAESFVQAGIYGITPVANSTYFYGGVSGIVSGSYGREIFTDDTRLHFGIEDAYLGLVGGEATGEGNRLVWNITAGRKRYSIGDGFLIANSASNAGIRFCRAEMANNGYRASTISNCSRMAT